MFLFRTIELTLETEIRNSLCILYGIGKFKAFLIVCRMGLGFPYNINKLNRYYYMILLKILDIYLWLDARLRRNTNMNIARFIEIGCYKGFRHKDNLPCRGQRTRTNAATRKKLKLILAL